MTMSHFSSAALLNLHARIHKTSHTTALTLIVAAVTAIVVCLSMSLGIEPGWALAGAVAMLAALVIMRKWPLALVVGLLFVGSFKSTPAQGISLTDPTLITLLLVSGAILIELLLVVSGSSAYSLQELCTGQSLGIICFVFFAATLAMSYLYTAAPAYGGEKLLHFVVFQTIVFFAPLIMLRNEKDLDQLLLAFLLLGLALAAKEIYGILHPTTEILSGNQDITHIGSAQLIGMSLLLCVYAKPFRRFLRMLVLPILGIGLVACAARGPLLSLLTVMIFYSVMTRNSTGVGRYKKIAALSLVVIVVTGALVWMEQYPAAQEKIVEKQQELESLVSGSGDPGGTTEQRLDFYRSALSDFSTEPLLGVGLGGWPVSYYGSEKPGYPHNIVLEVAAEQGIVGLAALFTFIAAVWLAARRIWQQRPELAFSIPLYIYSLLVSMFSGDINLRALWFWAGTIFAISRMCFSRASENGKHPVLQPA